jgi:hypothetical protein
MPWPFSRSRARRREPAAALERIVLRAADRSLAARAWSLRFEDEARLALADLADALDGVRRSADRQQRALALAATRDALDRLACESEDAAVAQACDLFGRILGAPGQSTAVRLQAADLALETLTFLVLAEGEDRERKAGEALRQLELAASRAAA